MSYAYVVNQYLIIIVHFLKSYIKFNIKSFDELFVCVRLFAQPGFNKFWFCMFTFEICKYLKPPVIGAYILQHQTFEINIGKITLYLGRLYKKGTYSIMLDNIPHKQL